MGILNVSFLFAENWLGSSEVKGGTGHKFLWSARSTKLTENYPRLLGNIHPLLPALDMDVLEDHLTQDPGSQGASPRV